MNAYADTSLLASLYLPELGSGAAAALLTRAERLTLTPLGQLELYNAIQLACFRGGITPRQARLSWARVESQIAGGWLVAVPWSDSIFAAAQNLARRFSAQLGTRSLDLLHVAAALALGVDLFLTRDQRQAALARAAGLRVRPAART